MTRDTAADEPTYPDETRHPQAYRAHEAAPVAVGDEVRVHMVEGGGPWRDEFPIRYEVKRIDAPNGLSVRNDYVLRAHHEDPPYMADGFGDTVLLTQLRRGESWEVIE